MECPTRFCVEFLEYCWINQTDVRAAKHDMENSRRHCIKQLSAWHVLHEANMMPKTLSSSKAVTKNPLYSVRVSLSIDNTHYMLDKRLKSSISSNNLRFSATFFSLDMDNGDNNDVFSHSQVGY